MPENGMYAPRAESPAPGRTHARRRHVCATRGSKGNSYSQAHGAAIERESRLRDQRPYLKYYNPGSGGPVGHPDNAVIIKK
jgi:hypothetical protein